MPIENDNTVVQVPLFYLERRMWASVTRHPFQFFNFFKEGCKNYLKILRSKFIWRKFVVGSFCC